MLKNMILPKIKSINRSIRGFGLIVFACIAPHLAYANAGLPMLAITLPALIIGLLPVIFIESLVLKKVLVRGFKDVFRVAFLSNIISTFVGVPITWAGLALFQMATGAGRAFGLETLADKFLAVSWQAPWLLPYEGQIHWMIPASTMFLLIPFFFASWFIEYMIAKRMFKGLAKNIISQAIFKANIVSYVFMEILASLWLAGAYIKGRYGL